MGVQQSSSLLSIGSKSVIVIVGGVENEELRNNQILTTSERQERLQQNQQKLEKLEMKNSGYLKTNNSNSNFPTSLIIGEAVLAVIGLITMLIIREKKKLI